MNTKDYTVKELLEYFENIPEELQDSLKITILSGKVTCNNSTEIPVTHPEDREENHAPEFQADESDIQKYLNFILDNQKDGKAPGRNKVVQGVGFSQEKCRTIHNILIQRGVITTGDKYTRINYS